jgi:hypothetical protein
VSSRWRLLFCDVSVALTVGHVFCNRELDLNGVPLSGTIPANISQLPNILYGGSRVVAFRPRL